jgi:hypothetical protein
MSLFHVAAQALVDDYLNERVVPPAIREAVVSAARTRLIEGKVPVLDESLCAELDRATARPQTQPK